MSKREFQGMNEAAWREACARGYEIPKRQAHQLVIELLDALARAEQDRDSYAGEVALERQKAVAASKSLSETQTAIAEVLDLIDGHEDTEDVPETNRVRPNIYMRIGSALRPHAKPEGVAFSIAGLAESRDLEPSDSSQGNSHGE